MKNILKRDCVFYKIEKDILDQINKIKSPPFEKFSVNEYKEDIYEINYTWVDHIRIKDKYITRQQKNVQFLFFKKDLMLIFFENSESQMLYTVEKIKEKCLVNLDKLDIFRNWESLFYRNSKFLGELISISYNKESGLCYSGEEETVDVSNIPYIEVKQYIQKYEVNHLAFMFKQDGVKFLLDIGSVISFNDTDEFEGIFYAICNIVESMDHL